MFRFLPSLLLAAPLLTPVATSAQVLPPAKSSSQKFIIRVDFVPVNTADLEAYGIKFDRLPLPQPHAFLQYATGNIVEQLWVTALRVYRLGGRSYPHKAFVTAADNSPVVITEDDSFRIDTASTSRVPLQPMPPPIYSSFQLQGRLTLTPHLTPGKWVTFEIGAAKPGGEQAYLKAIPFGGSLVMVAPNPHKADAPILDGLFWHNALPNTEELLVFVTLTQP